MSIRIVTIVAALAGSTLALSGLDPQTVHAQAESAQVSQGAQLYGQHCALCHGANGEGGAAFKTPIFGSGHQLSKFKTALGLFEYNQQLMPFDNPARVSDPEKLSVVAFQLRRSGLLAAGASIDMGNAAAVSLQDK